MSAHRIQDSRLSLTLAGLVVAFMVVFIALYESYGLDTMQAKTHRYGQFLEIPLWNLNESSARETLNLIARTEEYSTIVVYLEDGSPFVRVVETRRSGPIDLLFGALELVRKVPLSQPILYNGRRIGRIDATWTNRNIYVYLYTLVFCLLAATVVRYYLRLAQSRRELETNNQTLHQEIQERQRAESQLHHAHERLEHRVEERTGELALANQALARENEERQQAQGKLSASLEEKEMLLKEIHHRVKNNLQIISSMLNLQADRFDAEAPKAILQESMNRITAMSLIHEKLYRSKNLADINFDDYISSLATDLVHTYAETNGQVTLEMSVDKVDLEIDQAIPCGLIINELVSNAFKHAFPDHRPGKLSIEFAANTEGQFSLIVRDNGVGIPANFDVSKSNSLGMQLVNSLVRQLQGTIDIQTDAGTCFTIRFQQ